MAKKTESEKAEQEVTEETAVATTAGTAVDIAPQFDYGDDMGQDSDAQDNNEIKVPFLKILQPKSREVEKDSPKGAKSGMLLNTATGELYDGTEGIQLLTVYRTRVYVEWRPIDEGGGKVKTYIDDPEIDPEGAAIIARCRKEQDFGKWKNPDAVKEKMDAAAKANKVPNLESCNDIVETVYVWCILVDGDVFEPVVLSITSKKLKAWRDWVTMAVNTKIPNSGGRKPPFFAHQVRLSTWQDSNEFGEFTNVVIKPLVNENYLESLAPMGSPELNAAKEMRDLIRDGFYAIDEEAEAAMRGAEAAYSDAGTAGGGDTGDEDVPF